MSGLSHEMTAAKFFSLRVGGWGREEFGFFALAEGRAVRFGLLPFLQRMLDQREGEDPGPGRGCLPGPGMDFNTLSEFYGRITSR